MLWTIVVLLLILWLLGFLRLIGHFAIELVAFTTDRHQVHVHTTSWFPLHRENTMLPRRPAVPGAFVWAASDLRRRDGRSRAATR